MSDATAPIDAPAEEPGQPLYEPAVGELQLTARAVISGTFLGVVVASMNIYFGLRTGWSIGGSLIAAILSYSLFMVLKPKRPFTRLETNIAQTAGSAAGSMTSTAGLLAAIPAMMLLGYEVGWLELYLWTGSVAWLGVFFAVPLRRQMVLVERLRFPTGTATAETIMAMFNSGGAALRKSKALLWFAVGAAIFTAVGHFIPEATAPPLAAWAADWFGAGSPIALALGTAGAYGFIVYLSPLMLGAGVLIGTRVAGSLAVGALVAWAVLAPWVERNGWVDGPTMSYSSGARGWILWTGVAIMVGEALTQLALSWRSISATFRRPGQVDEVRDTSRDLIPRAWWVVGLTLATVLTITSAWLVFQIPPLLTVLAIALSSILAAIAVRSTGQTDINPIGGIAKVTQLVYGGVAPGAMATNLMAAGITSAGASQAGDMMHDLKTGYLLGASPRKQLVAQLMGITGGILVCVPIYMLFLKAYGIMGMPGLDEAASKTAFPAPAAQAWKAMAQLLSQGFDALPPNAGWGVLIGLALGTLVPIARAVAPRWLRRLLPSGLAFGIAFIIPAFYSLAMFFGTAFFYLWRARSPQNARELGFAMASGLIAGEGLMGVINSGLTLIEINAAWFAELVGWISSAPGAL